MPTKATLKSQVEDLQARLACYQGVPVRPNTPLERRDGAWAKDYGYFWGADEMAKGPAVLERIEAFNHRRDNVRVIPWKNGTTLPVTQPIKLYDLTLHDAKATSSLDGTAESNLWIGGTCESQRVDLRYGAWMGEWVGGQTLDPKGGCYGSYLSDRYIIGTPVGLYVELVTRQTEFKRYFIEASDTGVRIEWAHPVNGTYMASGDLLLDNFYVDMRRATGTFWRSGYAFDVQDGSYNVTIRNSVVIGGKGIAISKNARNVVIENVTDGAGNPTPITYL